MGGTLLALAELLRSFLTCLSVGIVVLVPVLALVLIRLVMRSSRARGARIALYGGLLALAPLAAASLLWLRLEGYLSPDRSLQTLRPRIGPISALAAIEDGSGVFVASGSGTAALCSFGPPSRCRRLRSGDFGFIEAVSASPDGRLLAAVSSLCELKVWERSGDSASLLHTTQLPSSSACVALHFSRGAAADRYAAWSPRPGADRGRKLFGEPLYRIAARTGRVTARLGSRVPIEEAFTADGNYVTELPIHASLVSDIDSLPSGELLASSSWDGTVKLWRPPTATPVRSLGSGERWFTALSIAPSRVVAGRADGRLFSWELGETGSECVLDLRAADLLTRQRLVTSLDYSPEREVAVAGAYDKKIVIADLSECRVVARLAGHRGGITGVRFLRGGTRFVSSSSDGSVRLWRLPPPELGERRE